jgi:hypothetical protein
MGSPPFGATVLLPRASQRFSSYVTGTSALAPELLSQSVQRLRILALLYAFTFFMAGFFPNLLFAVDRARFLQDRAN